MENEHTVAPRFGVISTSPSASSMVRACLTGVLLTPSRSASCSSIKRSSGPYSPVRIKPRNRSKALTGRAPCPEPRTTCPTQTPAFNPRRPPLYTILGVRQSCVKNFKNGKRPHQEAALAPSPTTASCGTQPTSWDSWPCRGGPRYRLAQQADTRPPLHVFGSDPATRRRLIGVAPRRRPRSCQALRRSGHRGKGNLSRRSRESASLILRSYPPSCISIQHHKIGCRLLCLRPGTQRLLAP